MGESTLKIKVAWWENLFKGNLSPGINNDKVDELEGESFLYFRVEIGEKGKTQK